MIRRTGQDTRSLGTLVLLERNVELGRLRELVAAATNQDGAVAVVEGPPGVGKTGLLEALHGLADDAGFEVLSARGDEAVQPR